MKTFFYRIYQFALNIASYLVHWPIPTLLEGENSVLKIPAILTQKGITRVLLVTDKTITNLGLTAPLLQELAESGIETAVFDETVPNPTIDNIEKAVTLYQASCARAIIAFGGGSSMDCAKGVGARIANPNKSIEQMRGLLKVNKPLPLLFAIPTTAGTGSETTIAAVISNPETHEKYAINDQKLIPAYAVLDPLLTIGLPPHITSTTGLDALTHAVEAYIGRSNTPETRKAACKAVKLIFDNLYPAYSNGKDVNARANMLKASFYAGIAFTRAYVGYVHAIAHTLGGYYSVPHGLANAVILPVVLEYYGHATDKPLAELADLIGITQPGESQSTKANNFIEKIRELEASMNIPLKIDGIKESDLPALIHNALHEANPLYPVTRELFAEDFRKLYDTIRQVD
jgi:alcohol dehydrogenase class IV